MRVVEPSHFKKIPNPKKARSNRFIFICGGIVIVIGLLFLRLNQIKYSDDDALQSEQIDETQPTDVPSEEILTPGEMRTFTGNEFKLFYDNLQQPNLDRVDVPPPISGNDTADTRIRAIAERRGYKLRSSPTLPLPSIDGYQLQEAVHQPWKELKQAAVNDDIPISIISAYRSVDNQRQLFLNRLRAEGVDITAVEQGLADAEIDNVLVTSSIPGYSKHHTGYTIDFICAGYEFENFQNSPCNDWITADNYRVAKQFGFIPSYPPDADLQGPAPEAWEYIWVGSELLVVQ